MIKMAFETNLPANSERYSQTLWKDPSGKVWTGKTGEYFKLAGEEWVLDTAVKYVDSSWIQQTDITYDVIEPVWEWSIAEGRATVSSASTNWDAILLSGINARISAIIKHERLWFVLGYSSPTDICCVGVTFPGAVGNFFGQVVNVDLASGTFSIVRAGVVPSAGLDTEVSIEIIGDSINMYKQGVLSESLSISELLGLGGNLSTTSFGIAAFNASSSITDGSVLGIFSVDKQTTVVEKIREISSNLTDSRGLKGFVLGDSISTADYGGLIDGQIWWQLVANRMGASFTANAISSTPIAEKPGFDSFVTDTRWQAADLDTDIYIIEGGINDFGARQVPLGSYGSTDKTEFYGALRYLFAGVAARYPRARIFYMTPMHARSFGFPAINNTTGLALQQYIDAAREVSDMVGITLIDMYRESGITYQNMDPTGSIYEVIYTTDGLHPNAAGHIRMSRLVYNRIMAIL